MLCPCSASSNLLRSLLTLIYGFFRSGDPNSKDPEHGPSEGIPRSDGQARHSLSRRCAGVRPNIA